MTKPELPKPIPLPVLLVYGKPTTAELPQAAWFHLENRQAVAAAATAMKLSTLEVATDADRALLAGLHEGVLKSTGRMIVGTVADEVYRRIEEHARKAASALPPSEAKAGVSGPKPAQEQNTNIVENGPAATTPAGADMTRAGSKPADPPSPAPSPSKGPLYPARAPWDGLQVGAYVLGKYWQEDGEPYGWWVAEIVGIETDDLVIRWPDEPRTLPMKIKREHVALLHPAFDVEREWDRKR